MSHKHTKYFELVQNRIKISNIVLRIVLTHKQIHRVKVVVI
jgi:hypothetical protein